MEEEAQLLPRSSLESGRVWEPTVDQPHPKLTSMVLEHLQHKKTFWLTRQKQLLLLFLPIIRRTKWWTGQQNKKDLPLLLGTVLNWSSSAEALLKANTDMKNFTD